jgi:hypothetical protein
LAYTAQGFEERAPIQWEVAEDPTRISSPRRRQRSASSRSPRERREPSHRTPAPEAGASVDPGGTVAPLTPVPEGVAPAEDAPSPPAPDDDPFAKFSGGFEGTFANTDAFFGGLDGLLGEPRKNVAEGVREEHCDVLDGFGASDRQLNAPTYSVLFTPRKEYLFVADPAFTKQMTAGVDWATKRKLGNRTKIPIEDLLTDAPARMQAAYKQIEQWCPAADVARFADLHVTAIEVTVGLDHIVALYYRSSTSYQIH